MPDLGRSEWLDSAIREAHEITQAALTQFDAETIEALLAGRNEAIDGLVSNILQHSSTRIDCAVSCNACCHQLVQVSPLEVIVLARTVARWTPTARKKLTWRLRQMAKLPAEPMARYGKTKPCPLLERGRCSVYADRPMACRAMLSASRAGCYGGLESHARTKGRDCGSAPLVAESLAYGASVQAGIDIALLQAGLKTEKLDLVRGLLLLIDDPSAEQRWLAGEDAFAAATVQGGLSHVESARMIAERLNL